MPRLFVAVLLFLACTPSAFASSISLVGAISYTGADYESAQPGTSADAKLALGLGGLLDFSLIPETALEFGAIYSPRKYTLTGPVGGFLVEDEYTYTSLRLPLLLRVSLAEVLS